MKKSDRNAWLPLTLLIILVGMVVGISAAIVLGHVREERAACANQLKIIGIAFKMYANESPREVHPPLQQYPIRLTPSCEALYPKYLEDARGMICPKSALRKGLTRDGVLSEAVVRACFDLSSYWYLGYAVQDEESGLELCEALEKAALGTGPLPVDNLPNGRLKKLGYFRMREGIERFFITEMCSPATSTMAQSKVPMLIERPGIHRGGAHVLFMDGHVEFMEYPGEFPMTKKFIGALERIDNLCRRGDG